MSWFRVDDKFHGHEKVKLIPRDKRAEAVGTWTLCGTWSADFERDGFVPLHMIDELGGTIAGADALVDVKLWKRRRDGYQFHNWKQFQPTRAENEARRENERVRKANQRAARKPSDSAAVSADVPLGQTRVPNTPSRSRPDPTRPDEDLSSLGKLRGVIHSEDDSAVHNPLVRKVVEVCSERGVAIHPLVVPDLIEFIEQRRGPKAKPIQAVERYFPNAIAASWPEVEQFIHQKGLAS